MEIRHRTRLDVTSQLVGRNIDLGWKKNTLNALCFKHFREAMGFSNASQVMFVYSTLNINIDMAPQKHAVTTRKRNGQDRIAAPILMPVAVDLIRFEKNLLQMGFFGAHDTRHTHQSTRRIEQAVNRDGQKIKVAAEFRASQELGLPSTSDRDKYIAFMRIAMDQKAKHGTLHNPIRFTGYRLLKELGLSYSGENYEDINRWGQRMADTTITSEKVMYFASRRQYANQTVHVFRRFTRAGQSDENGSGRTESFEVVLEDWLLENLNQGYVVPEDFNAYRTLKRATAKGVFGLLHLWFHASQGRPVEKNYTELCMLLNIPAYKHVSKIRETIGRSLDELGSIGYLRKWDIGPMATKQGYKLILEPGDEVLRLLTITQRKQISEQPVPQALLTGAQQEALKTLLEHGVSAPKAKELVSKNDPDGIIDQIEYADFLISRDKRGKIQNPAGFIIYAVERSLALPTDFATSRQRKAQQEREYQDAQASHQRFMLEESYRAFVEQEVERAVCAQLPGEQLTKKIKEIIKRERRANESFENMSPQQQANLAERYVWSDVRESLALPSFQEWLKTVPQMDLFQSQ